jgi:hypothetical protein
MKKIQRSTGKGTTKVVPPKPRKKITNKLACKSYRRRFFFKKIERNGGKPQSRGKRMKKVNVRGYEKPRSASWEQDNVRVDPGGAIVHPWIGRGITTRGFR